MNEQLQNALATILGKTIEGIDSSVAFMQSELPDVIEQLLLWYAVKGVTLFIFGVLLSAMYLVALFKAYNSRPIDGSENLFWERWEHKNNNEFNFGWTLTFGFCGAFVFPASAIMCSGIMDSIQIWIAPKIWLIEYASKLVG